MSPKFFLRDMNEAKVVSTLFDVVAFLLCPYEKDLSFFSFVFWKKCNHQEILYVMVSSECLLDNVLVRKWFRTHI